MIFFNIPITYGMTFTNILQRKMYSYKYSVKISISDPSFNFFLYLPRRLLDHMVHAWVISYSVMYDSVRPYGLSDSLSDSSIHGFLQARILKWVAIPSSKVSSRPRDWTHVSYISCIGWLAGSLPLARPGKPLLLLTSG